MDFYNHKGKLIQLTAQKFRLLTIISSTLFIFLCFFHYFSLRPLWLDEVSVLKNIEKFRCLNLLGPLDHAQAFPRLYLVIIKIISMPFQYHLLALRFLPLIAMFGAFFVWQRVFRTVFQENWQYILALFSFSCSHYLSYYAAELKPYSLDVLAVGSVTLLLLHMDAWQEGGSSWSRRLMILAVPLVLFFSYAGIFIFWLVGYKMISWRLGREKIFLLSCFSILTCAVLAGIYYIDLRHSWGNAPLMDYWESYFICTDSTGCFMKTFWEGVRRLSTWWFGKSKFFVKWATFLIPFFLYGIFKHGFAALKNPNGRNVSPEIILSVFFAELFVLGILKKYPFTGERITLFFAPFVFIIIIKSFGDIRRFKYLFVIFLLSYFFLLGGSLVETLGIYYNYYL
ncbi:MAG: hypothetical protein KAR05_10100 [Candidatus Omnitrophica bacterium]|nr:hypothetical protein [Candidatus Omnitrophota bacterium]